MNQLVDFESTSSNESLHENPSKTIQEPLMKETNEILPKRHFHPTKKDEIMVDDRTLIIWRVKRIQVISWSFEGEKSHLKNQRLLRNLTKNIKKTKKTRKLNVNCSKELGFTKKILREGLKTLPNLQRVDLNFDSSKFKYLNVENICHSLKNVASLKDIHLDFSNFDKELDLALDNMGVCLKRMLSLQNITLNCSSTKTTDFGIEPVCQSIKSFPNLKNLNFNFGVCIKMTNAPLLQLGYGLQTATSLQSLTLSFLSCFEITDIGVLRITENLKNLIFLENIALKFSNSDVSDASLDSLADAFKVLSSLKSISLCFQGCGNIVGTGLWNLSTSLMNHTRLTSLALDFKYCRNMVNADATLSKIGDSLRSIASLQNCILVFAACPGITDTGICGLNQGIKWHTTLRNLTLDFAYCPDITDAALYDMSDYLKTFMSLETVQICCRQAVGVTSKGASSVDESLKGRLQKLKEILLFFPEERARDRKIIH